MPFERRIGRQTGRSLGLQGHLPLEVLDLAFEPRDVPPLVRDHFRLAFELCVPRSTFVLPVPFVRGLGLPTPEQKTGHDPHGRLEEFGAFDP